MVHYFKRAGQRIALDEASGFAAPVDEITYKMLAYLTLPLPDDCPSAIRYDMAKYDSRLVDRAYAGILALHREGKLYTDVPFDLRRAVTLCTLTSVSPLSSLEGSDCPVLLCDTENAQNAAALISRAKEMGRFITVIQTTDGIFECDRLIVDEARYASCKNNAPVVGVRFAYNVKSPDILKKVIALADEGITLIDAYPENPRDARAGEQTVLLKELERTAKELFLRKKEGRAVEFLPISMHGIGAKHTLYAHDNVRCGTCSHRMTCGGRCLSPADCEVKRALADSAVMLEIC